MDSVDWESVDWTALERLRDVFLGRAGAGRGAPYWSDARQLASYDFTFGRRIAWKWAAVIADLQARDWAPPAPALPLVDWGCGTGIAARSAIAHFGAESFSEVVLWDHAPAATTFATEVLQTRAPDLAVRVADPAEVVQDGAFVLTVSHVLNELDTAGRDALIALAARAAAVLWVEPGTAEDSGALIAVRERLRGGWNFVAPCPHDGPCGLLAPGNERHWCHHFGRPPTEAFTEQGWALFGRRLGIDLRSLPYSYLVLDRRAPAREPGAVRMIGTPRPGPGGLRVLRCATSGVADVELPRRSAPELVKRIEKGRHHGTFVWEEKEGRVSSGQASP